MTEHATYLTLTEKDFTTAVLESADPVLVDFWATWCGPCKMMAPVIEELADDFAGRATVGKVDVDAQPRLATQFGIKSIPTLLFFKDGKIVDRSVGATPKEDLTTMLEELVEVG